MNTMNTSASDPKPARHRYTVRASIRIVVSSMLPSSATSWKSGCSGGAHASCMACATCRSRPVNAPAVMAIVSVTKPTLSRPIATRRGTRGTGGAPPGPLVLATAAEDGRAAGDADRAQRSAAREAGLARAAVDEQLFLLATDHAPGVSVCVDAAAAVCDRDLKRLAQRLVEAPRRFPAHRAGDAIWSQARTVQRLVGVDVADARNGALVEQHRLERRPPLAEAAVKLFGRKPGVDRLRPKHWHLLR